MGISSPLGGSFYGNWQATQTACGCTAAGACTYHRAIAIAQQNACAAAHSVSGAGAGGSCNIAYPVSLPPEPLERAGITVGEIIGWRCWIVDGPSIKSVAMNYEWTPGEPMTGEPSDHGREGVYAFKDAWGARDMARYIPNLAAYGAVALWGEVVEHERGYRAECARIVSLDGVFSQYGFSFVVGKAALRRLRKRYGVGAFEDVILHDTRRNPKE